MFPGLKGRLLLRKQLSKVTETRSRLLLLSHRCCVWHSTPQSSVDTWGQNTQIWVKAVRTDDGSDENRTFKMKPSAFWELVFGYLAYFLERLESFQVLEKRQVACRTGSFKCGNWVGLCIGHRFEQAHMLVFYHPPFLFPSLPLLLLSSGEESSADCSSGLSPLYEQCFCGWKPS